MNQNYDVIVVGAGIGGAVCAALLAHRGLSTLLVDKNSIPGGKAMTVASDGYRYEFWPVAGGPAIGSVFEQVSAELGVEAEVEMLTPSDAIHTLYRDASGQLQSHIGSTRPGEAKDPLGVFSILGFQASDFTEVLRFLNDVNSMEEEAISDLDGVSFLQFVSAYKLPQSLISYFGMQANVIFVVPIDQLAASEMIRVMRDFGKGGAGRYHRGGFGRIAEVYCRSIEDNGGRVILSTRIERILVQDGRVTGVATEKGEFYAPVVISNAGIQPTVLKLAGESCFDTGYVDYVKALVPSRAIIGARYFLDKPVFKEGMHVYFSDTNYMDTARFDQMEQGQVPNDLSVFNVIPAAYDDALAPPGKQCALVGTFVPPDPSLQISNALLKKLDQVVMNLWPKMADCIEARVFYGNSQVSDLTRDSVVPGQGGECIGLAQIVGQCGAHKPAARSPLPGLYFVGCDAGGYGCGTHQAADSGVKVAEMVLADQSAGQA
jgi:prolycopene isomerase